MAIAFTCNVCSTRSVKTFSKIAYNNGVVIVQCPHCSSNHLIADNLGWFKDTPTNIETIMAEKGQAVARVSSVEDMQRLVGSEKLARIRQAVEEETGRTELRLEDVLVKV